MLYTLKTLGVYLTFKSQELLERAGLTSTQESLRGSDDTTADDSEPSGSTIENGARHARTSQLKRPTLLMEKRKVAEGSLFAPGSGNFHA